MKGDVIPSEHHIARYCGGLNIDGDDILPAAFMLREGESMLSVDWLEHSGKPARAEQIDVLRAILSLKLNRVGTNARLAVLNVGSTLVDLNAKRSAGNLVSATHEPRLDDVLHSGIHNIRPDHQLAATILAESIIESHSARS